MIDIHSHILPGLDDGPVNIDESLEILKVAIAEGISDIIATPHYLKGSYKTTFDVVFEKVKELNNACQNNNLDIKIYPGSEIYIDTDTLNDILNKKIPTLNNGCYVLIELPFNTIPLITDKIIFELLINKYVPIIAHPERNLSIINNPVKLYNLIEKGALTQCNTGSLLGEFGSDVIRTIKLLLQKKYIHFVGSDAHSLKKRTYNFTKWIEEASKYLGIEYATDMVTKFPKKIINSDEIFFSEPEMLSEENKSTNFFKNLLEKILG